MAGNGPEILNRLRLDEDLKYIAFIINEEEIKVNKTLMTARCVYFKTMLFGNTNEACKSTICLNSTPKVALKKIVEYIHTGECDVDGFEMEYLLEMLSLAHEYQFNDFLKNLFLKIEIPSFDVDFCNSYLT
ncbi:BTB:POZ domain containing protein-like protein [Leptotrombidium deliense]|uniref:BTB:POZ domain containing protein-like protein n=1 Tax=Leptotrombidium deliense TaxID=299467 RepID=A0A443RU79_9ACAR|nr:BTB:POZ domain containing protein-like protein [Leptotrombidium deliense]